MAKRASEPVRGGMRVIAWFKGLKSAEQIAAVSLLVAILGLMPAWYVLVDHGDSSAPSDAAAACPTLDLPDTVQRGVAFAVQKADNFQAGETVQLVMSPGGESLLRPDGTTAIYARGNGSFAGTTIMVPRDAPVGEAMITAEREQHSNCDEPSVDVVVT
jgi:hypothetical protein